MIVLFLIFAVWVGLGWLGSAYAYNYLQHVIPVEEKTDADKWERSDFRFAVSWIFAGPAYLLAMLTGGYSDKGPRFRRYKYINGVRQP